MESSDCMREARSPTNIVEPARSPQRDNSLREQQDSLLWPVNFPALETRLRTSVTWPSKSSILDEQFHSPARIVGDLMLIDAVRAKAAAFL